MAKNGRSSRKRTSLPENTSSHPLAPKMAKAEGLPSFITEKLDQMKKDILSNLSNMLSSSPENSLSKNEFNSKLKTMLQYYFKGGKMLRPTVALLIAAGCNQLADSNSRMEITENQYKLAMIGEMIHVAGLVHDDVVDEADSRRGKPSLNALWGNKAAVLTGDLILAKTFQILTSMERADIAHLVNKIIQDTVEGEIMQVEGKGSSLEEQLAFDLERQYKDTASMFESLCRGVAILSDGDQKLQDTAAEYGRHFGLSYRLVDCVLDCDAEKSDKNIGIDLRQGVITAPVLLASQKSPKLQELVAREFSKPGDIENALVLIQKFGGHDRAMSLAREHSEKAKELTKIFSNNDRIAENLVYIVVSQIERRK